MPVRSYEIKSAHVFSADDLAKAQPAIYAILAVILWLLSFSGNVLLFGGGWESFVAARGDGTWPRVIGEALALSFAYQALCTIVQFVFCNRWTHPLYIAALLASFVPSVLGYAPFIIEPLSGRAHPVILYIGLGIMLLAVDIIPERVFVKR